MQTVDMISFELRRLSILVIRYIDQNRSSECGCLDSNDIDENKQDMSRHHMQRMTQMHKIVLGYLHNNQHKDIFQKDFEKEFSIRRPTVTNMLNRMEKNGLIARIPVPGDARLKKIVLTEKSRKFSKDMENHAMVLEKKMLAGLSEEEIGTFSTILRKIINNMEE